MGGGGGGGMCVDGKDGKTETRCCPWVVSCTRVAVVVLVLSVPHEVIPHQCTLRSGLL